MGNLTEKMSTLEEDLMNQIELMRGVINKLAVDSDDMCSYCMYNIPCDGKDCEYYEEGIGLRDADDKYYDWKWSCMDFDFGTCKKLAGTPCCECTSGENQFRWNGRGVDAG